MTGWGGGGGGNIVPSGENNRHGRGPLFLRRSSTYMTWDNTSARIAKDATMTSHQGTTTYMMWHKEQLCNVSKLEYTYTIFIFLRMFSDLYFEPLWAEVFLLFVQIIVIPTEVNSVRSLTHSITFLHCTISLTAGLPGVVRFHGMKTQYASWYVPWLLQNVS
jgi:hypothetical protein